MLWVLLCLLALSCGETRRLAVHPRLKKLKKPLEIQAAFKAGSEADTNGRSKRSLTDDHGSDWDNKINITKVRFSK